MPLPLFLSIMQLTSSHEPRVQDVCAEQSMARIDAVGISNPHLHVQAAAAVLAALLVGRAVAQASNIMIREEVTDGQEFMSALTRGVAHIYVRGHLDLRGLNASEKPAVCSTPAIICNPVLMYASPTLESITVRA